MNPGYAKVGAMACKALFLDRDGTINIDTGYVYRIEDFQLLPGILELGCAAVQHGYRLIVCTNQSGIARGYYTEDDYRALSAYMATLFRSAGCPLTAIYHCPELEGARRKPAPGMFLEASADWEIDLPHSLSLGDKERDAAAAYAAGIRRNYLLADQLPPTSRATGTVSSPWELIPLL